MEKNYEEWMDKTVATEKQDWLNDSLPEHDDTEKYYHTSAPVIIFQMINQHLQVTNTIHSELTFNALVMSIQQVTKYGMKYRYAIIELKEKHFKDRSQMPFFTHHIITIVNNCQQIIELAQQMKQLYWPKSRTERYEEFEKLLRTYQVDFIVINEGEFFVQLIFNYKISVTSRRSRVHFAGRSFPRFGSSFQRTVHC